MPLIGTSGALSVNKASTEGSGGFDAWMMQWETPTTNRLFYSVPHGRQIFSGASLTYFILTTDDSYGLPVISFARGSSSPAPGTTTGIYDNNNNIYTVGRVVKAGIDQAKFVSIQTITDSSGNVSFYRDNAVGTSSTQSSRVPYAVIADASDNYWVVGRINEIVAGVDHYKFYVSKFNGDTKISSVVLTQTKVPDYSSITGHPGHLFWTSDDYLLIGLESVNAGLTNNFLSIIKFDQNTNTIIWQRQFDLPTYAGGSTTLQDVFGNIFVTFGNNVTNETTVYKFDSTGSSICKMVFSYSSNTVTIDDSGNLYFYASDNVVGTDFYIIKLDAQAVTPSVLWCRKISSGFTYTLSWAVDHIYIGVAYTNGAGHSPALIKLPDSGAVPGSGSYVTPLGDTLTYTGAAAPPVTVTSFSDWYSGLFSVGAAVATTYVIASGTGAYSTPPTTLAVQLE
jgi:hypothetical protein